MPKINTGRGLFLMAILMVALLGIRHFDLLQAPNSYYIGDSLDGFRSMSANFYHIRHDSTYHHYNGMHYPYGDHPGYADTFPLLTNAVKYFFKGDDQYFLGIWNLSLVFSQFLCGLFMFLLFRELQLPVWYSIAAAIGLSTLTPQLDRFAAHYALSYSFLFPLCIWLLLRFGRQPKIYLSVLIGLIPILANEIHPYLMAMVVFMVAGYFSFRFLYQPSWKNLRWLLSHATIQVVLPLAYLLFTTVLNDPITDRPAWPWGFTFYTTRLQSLLLPIDLPLGHWIDQNIDDLGYVLSETRAYLGMVAIFGGLFLLGRYFYFRIRPSENQLKMQATLKYLMWAAFVILLYAACIPFVFFDWGWLTDYLGLLRQFRVLGRFAWVFFYVSNIVVLYGLFQVFSKMERKWLRQICFGLTLGVLLTEGIGYFFWEKYDLMPRPENREHFGRQDNPWLYSLDMDKYQAILPIPFYHIGSENFWINPVGVHLNRSVWAGAESGLPAMASFMGRTSISQTIKLIETVAEPYRRPALLDDLPDQRPLLVFITKNAYKHIGYRYAHLTRGATQVYEDETIRLLELPISSFEKRVEVQQNGFRQEVDSTQMYAMGEEIFVKDSLRNFIYDSYDQESAEFQYQGKGAKVLTPREDHILFEGPMPNQQTKEDYVISLWAKMDYDLAPRMRMLCTEYEPESGAIVHKTNFALYEYIRSVDNGWMLIDMPIRMKRTDTALRVSISNNDLLYGQKYYLDEFQIRARSARLYRKEANWAVVNNRWIPR